MKGNNLTNSTCLDGLGVVGVVVVPWFENEVVGIDSLVDVLSSFSGLDLNIVTASFIRESARVK
jgi:hypothetical protein